MSVPARDSMGRSARDGGRRSLRSDPWLSTVLRMIVHAVTAGVIAFPLTVIEGVAAAGLGGALGALLARFVAHSSLRIHTILLSGLGALLAVLALRFTVVDLSFVPAMLGPSGALRAGDAVVFGLGGLVVSAVLRSLSLRRPSLSVLEAAIVAGGFATLLVAHRNGAIHRPYEIADPLIARGEDPTFAILIIGALGAAVIGLLLLSERSLARSAFHVGVVAVLLLAILGTTAMNGLPPPPPGAGGALGLQDDDAEARRRREQQQGQGQGRRDSDELEFLDEYPDGQGAPDAIIIFHDDYSAPSGYYYFRQNAFSQYNGRKLIAATGLALDEDVRNVFPTGRSRAVEWVPPAGDDRAEVETTVGMLADNSAPLGLEAPTRFVPATNPNPDRFRRLYRVESSALTADPMSLLGREVGDRAWSEDVAAHYTRGPDDPRYRALAEHIVAQLPESLRDDPVARALAITQYLGQHGTYSLRSRHAGAEDPTADFLFGDLTGYCVHFSHAAVYLMRSLGLPARVGTGYAVAEQNRAGGSGLLLRNSDQHAWPELYVGGAPALPPPELFTLHMFVSARGDGDTGSLGEEEARFAAEVVRDAAVARLSLAPSEERDQRIDAILDGLGAEAEIDAMALALERTPASLLAAAIAYAASLPRPDRPHAGWVVMDVAPENVLGSPGQPPDPELQRLLAEMARGSTAIEDAPVSPRPMAELVRELTGPLFKGLGIVVLAIFAFLVANKVRRRVTPLVSASPSAIYLASLDVLSEGGLRRAWGESHEAFAARLSRQLPSLRVLTHGHLAAAFGAAALGRRTDEAHIGAMKRAARALRGELKSVVPWWRRALGWINPFSWLLTR